MKVYSANDFTSAYYVGTTTEIKTLYKSIIKSSAKGNCNLCPGFCDFPRFSPSREIYALSIDCDGYVTVLNSDTMLSLIVSGYVREP